MALAAIGSLAAAAAALTLALLTRAPQPQRDFAPRGVLAGPPVMELRVYRIPRGGKPELAGESISATDELAFAYRNGSARRRLMIFGQDDRRALEVFSTSTRRVGPAG